MDVHSLIGLLQANTISHPFIYENGKWILTHNISNDILYQDNIFNSGFRDNIIFYTNGPTITKEGDAIPLIESIKLLELNPIGNIYQVRIQENKPEENRLQGVAIAIVIPYISADNFQEFNDRIKREFGTGTSNIPARSFSEPSPQNITSIKNKQNRQLTLGFQQNKVKLTVNLNDKIFNDISDFGKNMVDPCKQAFSASYSYWLADALSPTIPLFPKVIGFFVAFDKKQNIRLRTSGISGTNPNIKLQRTEELEEGLTVVSYRFYLPYQIIIIENVEYGLPNTIGELNNTLGLISSSSIQNIQSTLVNFFNSMIIQLMIGLYQLIQLQDFFIKDLQIQSIRFNKVDIGAKLEFEKDKSTNYEVPLQGYRFYVVDLESSVALSFGIKTSCPIKIVDKYDNLRNYCIIIEDYITNLENQIVEGRKIEIMDLLNGPYKQLLLMGKSLVSEAKSANQYEAFSKYLKSVMDNSFIKKAGLFHFFSSKPKNAYPFTPHPSSPPLSPL